uniref:Uncharacterized protein n=1 Tax=Lygus hesperus TaxID=30085 RepID=A0A0A9YM31_LYGHE
MDAFHVISNDYLYALFICEPIWSCVVHEKSIEFISCLRTLRALRTLLKSTTIRQQPSTLTDSSSIQQIIEYSILLKRQLNKLYNKPLKDENTFKKLLSIRHRHYLNNVKEKKKNNNGKQQPSTV